MLEGKPNEKEDKPVFDSGRAELNPFAKIILDERKKAGIEEDGWDKAAKDMSLHDNEVMFGETNKSTNPVTGKISGEVGALDPLARLKELEIDPNQKDIMGDIKDPSKMSLDDFLDEFKREGGSLS